MAPDLSRELQRRRPLRRVQVRNNFMAPLVVSHSHHPGDRDLVPVLLSTSKSLVYVQGAVRGVGRGVYPGDALATLRLSGQQGPATLTHVEVVMWTKGLRGEVSAA